MFLIGRGRYARETYPEVGRLPPAPLPLARVVTPNGQPSLGPFVGGFSGRLLVVDITPTKTGLLICQFQIGDLSDSTVEGIDFEVFIADNLTGITGGTLIAPGLTASEPGNLITAVASDAPVFVGETVTPPVSPAGTRAVYFNAPLQAVVGHRTAIIAFTGATGDPTFSFVSASVVEV